MPRNDQTTRVLALVEDLGSCEDTTQVLRAATRRFAELFGAYAAFVVLVSDRAMERWHLLALRFPRQTGAAPTPERLSDVDALPSHDSLDALAEEHGVDVTGAVLGSPALLAFFREHEEAQFAVPRDGFSPVPPVAEEAVALMQGVPALANVATVNGALLAASWRRPEGGRGCVLVPYPGPMPDALWRLDLFALAVKLTTRLAFYPGYVNVVAQARDRDDSLRSAVTGDLLPAAEAVRAAAARLESGAPADPATRETLTQESERLVSGLRGLLGEG
jgi:hypothetical protein